MTDVAPVPRRRLAALVALLLMASAALLVVGVSLECAAERGERPAAGEAGEGGERGPDESAEGQTAEAGGRGEDGEAGVGGERVPGLPIESTGALAAMAVVTVGLAAAVWWRPSRVVAGTVVVLAVAAGVLDVAEVSHQVGVDRAGLAVLAGLIAATRVAVVVGAAQLWRAASRTL